MTDDSINIDLVELDGACALGSSSQPEHIFPTTGDCIKNVRLVEKILPVMIFLELEYFSNQVTCS